MIRTAIFALVLLAGDAWGIALGAGVRVPFELERNRVVISARINGSRPIRLILDTGMVNGLLLRPSDLARELGLKPSRKIIVDGAGAGAPIEADLAHGATVTIGDRFTVDDVIPGSPAHLAGILVGDVLNAIDGRPAEKLTPTEVERMFQEKAGGKNHLDLTRGTRRVSVKVRLTRLI